MTPPTLTQLTYDNAGRLQYVTNGTATATYSYLANSPLIGQITLKQGANLRMTTTKQYDFLNRLTAISSASSASSAVSSSYDYNLANQRARNVEADGSYWRYQYDPLGQVKAGTKYWPDQTPIAGQQFGYAFDDIGNRASTTAGGDDTGANLRSANYYVNNLNQYTSRDVPGAVDVTGVDFTTNTVTVAGLTPYRKGEYFRKEISVNNGATPVWTNIIVSATGQTPVSGNVFVPKTQEQFLYDADGNLTNDGRWSYTWDAENRLTNIMSLATAPAGSQLKLEFTYDYMGRRIQKIVSTNSGSAYVPQYTNRFVYDGWNLVAILNPQSSVIRSFAWGTDLSGTLQGAGGVGGLLAVCDSPTTNFAAYDGNGNLMALINAGTGTNSALYEYGPFGEVLRATGPMAKANPFRFSTKFQDDESDLVYYGYRYYNASTGRWLSRDPFREPGFEVSAGRPAFHNSLINLAGERGNPNLFGFIRNNPANDLDLFGLCDAPSCKCGKDVTTQVFQTLQDIADTFANANSFRRWEATWSMFGVLSFSSWDILYLYNYVNPYPTVPGCGVCDRSVTFQGMCVRPNELNYIMYGWAIQVTGYPRTLALFELGSGLAVRGGEDRQAQFRKMAFATYGSDFGHNLPPWAAFPSIPQCQPVTEKSNYDIHDWRWMGLKWTGW